MSEKISVIVPVYQVEAYLERCVDSILKQTYQNLEIILVDDGSTDQCPEICDEYEKKDPRIKVIHKENGGLSSARNAGLDAAEGELIAFVDSDDFIEADMLEKLYDALTEHEADMSVCNLEWVDEHGRNIRGCYGQIFRDGCMDPWNYWEKVLDRNNTCFVVAWNKLYRKEIWKKLRYPAGKLNEDEFVLHEIIRQCSRIAYVPYVGYNYVQRTGSIMSNKKKEPNFDVFSAWSTRIHYFNSIGREDLSRKQLVPYVEALIYMYHLCRTLEEKENFKLFYRTYQSFYRKLDHGTFVSAKEKIMKTGMERAPILINIAMRLYRFLWIKFQKLKSNVEQRK